MRTTLALTLLIVLLAGCRSDAELRSDPTLNALFNGFEIVEAIFGEGWKPDLSDLSSPPDEDTATTATLVYPVVGPNDNGSLTLMLRRHHGSDEWFIERARVWRESSDQTTDYVMQDDGAWIPALPTWD
jgi:hypothetical protein